MGFAHEYADAVLYRGRVPMEPADFVPDWPDGPRRGKFYPGAEPYALPDGDGLADAPARLGLLPPPGGPAGSGAPGFTLPLLSAMLKDSYGLTGRRLGVQANSDLSGLPLYPHANWSRGTAGGGGLYPVSVHWVSGPSGPLTPGVHHYDVHRHAVRRLLTGDVTDRVREALGADAPAGALGTDQYLVLGVKYWQTAFKYNSFGYHVVCTDVGTLVQTWRVWAAAHGLRVAPVLWFDEPRLNGLLGADGEEESVFAVVPLRWEDGTARAAPPGGAGLTVPPGGAGRQVLPGGAGGSTVPGAAGRAAPPRGAGQADSPGAAGRSVSPDAAGGPVPPGGTARTASAAGPGRGASPGALARTASSTGPGHDGTGSGRVGPGRDPAVRHRDVERSRTVVRFPTVLAMHAATVAGATDRPAPGALAASAARPVPGGGTRIALPTPELPEVPVRRVLRNRRSSFGRFDATVPVTPGQLSTVLAACAATSLGGDAAPEGTPRQVRLYAFVNHVGDIAPGAYVYDADAGELSLVVPGPQGRFLQENYFLANYNLEQAGAVLVPTVRTAAVLDAVGDRGYRLAVGTAGAVAQTFYLAASALSLGAGVALGFDNVSFVERLDLAGTEEAPLLIMPLGNERPGPADFRHEIA
ncbi:nitroreductase family protein [Streptomyces sp. NPDC092359]|uniref:nitroreductase family protein n=1 Tax=Streptomyces sp. NPDC092359 TaxID=3366014 RepID=UPI0038287B9D